MKKYITVLLIATTIAVFFAGCVENDGSIVYTIESFSYTESALKHTDFYENNLEIFHPEKVKVKEYASQDSFYAERIVVYRGIITDISIAGKYADYFAITYKNGDVITFQAEEPTSVALKKNCISDLIVSEDGVFMKFKSYS